jgi:hypothetical protein
MVMHVYQKFLFGEGNAAHHQFLNNLVRRKFLNLLPIPWSLPVRDMMGEEIKRVINAAFLEFQTASTWTGVISSNINFHGADYGRDGKGKAIVI